MATKSKITIGCTGLEHRGRRRQLHCCTLIPRCAKPLQYTMLAYCLTSRAKHDRFKRISLQFIPIYTRMQLRLWNILHVLSTYYNLFTKFIFIATYELNSEKYNLLSINNILVNKIRFLTFYRGYIFIYRYKYFLSIKIKAHNKVKVILHLCR